MVTGTTIFAGLLMLIVLLTSFGDDQHGIRSVQGLQGLQDEPQLNGSHFRITVVEERGFLDFNVMETTDGNGSSSSTVLSFSGYCIDLLNAIARPDRANFTFELIPPSGTGSLCEPMLNQSQEQLTASTFDPVYYTQYNCGQSEVTDVPFTNYTTDMYLSMFYITPERQRLGQFSMAFAPPHSGRNVMFGTATRVRDVQHLVQLQQAGQQTPVCMPRGAANMEFVQRAFPDIEMVEVLGTGAGLYEALDSGLCEVIIFDHPLASHFVLERSRRGECLANGKPIGIIGDPFTIGLDHYGIGIRSDIPNHVVRTINYWLNVLMTCAPADPNTVCPGGNGSLESLYADAGGTGRECGYVQFPDEAKNGGLSLSTGGIIGVVLGAVALVVIICSAVVVHKLRQQRRRIRKRFVQQIARNIAIGPSPGSIPPTKLAEQVQHIGDSNGVILKEDLRKWMDDVKLEFISEKDFEALWAAMDVDGSGKVDAVEFFIFLSSCGPQFEEVYNEEQSMSKMERLKLAARRLSVINSEGEAGVKMMEHKLERRSRAAHKPLGEINNGELHYSEEMRREVERAARRFSWQRSTRSIRRSQQFSDTSYSESVTDQS